jgi:hypothetical protein
MEVFKATGTNDLYLVQMTREQIRVMQHLCNNVGGQPSGPRGVADDFAKMANLLLGYLPYYDKDYSMAGSIYIDNWPKLMGDDPCK